VSASLSAGSKTVTVRRSSRLRPLSWVWADPCGAVVAETSWIRWRRVGWLSLTPTIRATLAAAAASNVFLAVQRVERDDGAGGEAQFGQQGLRRRDLVGPFGDVDVGEHQRGVGGGRAQHLGGCAVMELVETAAQRLAIESDAALSRRGARRPQQGGMAAEGRLHPGRVEPLEDVADGRVRRRAAPFQAEGRVQLAAVDVDEGDDVRRTSPFDAAIRVAAGHDGQDGKQQHMRQLVELSLCPARIRNVRQHIQQRRKRSHSNLRPSCRRRGQTLAGSGTPLAISRLTSHRKCGGADSTRPIQQR